MRRTKETHSLGMTQTHIYSSRDACLNEGVMLRFIQFFLILSYLGTSARNARSYDFSISALPHGNETVSIH